MTDTERLFDILSELPPEDVVDYVTPWKKAMSRILVGFALTTVTLNFLWLNYLLPAIGAMLILLGFRALRSENQWFKCSFVLSSARIISLYTALLMETTVITTGCEWILTAVNTVLMLLTYVCLRNGIAALQKKADLRVNVRGATGLIVWYIAVLLLALVRYQGYIIAIGMLACYFFIIRNLFKTSAEIGNCGYAVRTSAVKLSDGWLVIITVLLVTLGTIAGYTLGGSHPMNWTPAEPSELDEIKGELMDLGFPEDILGDLTDEDILACEGALAVTVDVNYHPANDGREVTEYRDNGFYTTTVYDRKELCITGIGVKLPGGREEWKIIHHFRWTSPHSKYGTECIQLWPAYRQGNGWVREGEVSGRVLCDINGVPHTADYYYLGDKTYTSNNFLFGSQTSRDIFAEFSMNKEGENHRGYLSYTTAVAIDGYILDSWMNYTHQKTWLQFPAKTAMEYRMTNGFGIGGAFITIQDALQMHKGELI